MLWHALRGGGSGFGCRLYQRYVTLAAVYRFSSRNLTDDEILSCRLVFPAEAVGSVVHIFLALTSPSPALSASLVFMRAPSTAPVPGVPVVMLGLTVFGAAPDAERICASTFEGEVMEKAIVATAAMVGFAKMNDGIEASNRLGEWYKDLPQRLPRSCLWLCRTSSIRSVPRILGEGLEV
ncbi:hypothetical protein P280DRAFT_473610 [Massarina eburnea CBS 473.64]|uniref:Uncharacterized protein n=1 Tax=Massarina eburnea CBS 473.64 TaxID=1395130 RepID=A0A6A6RND9_9PLEO|nr:hypothetical protein P280DRAFT_473610 [Massarina eburnea CBS 473.64]